MKWERVIHNRFGLKNRFLLGGALVLAAIALVVLLIAAGGGLFSSPSPSPAAESSQPAGFKIELATGSEAAYDFCETGSVAFNNAGSGNDTWLMLYRPQGGTPASEKVAVLSFDAQSMCELGSQPQLCEPGILLASGASVQVKGIFRQGALLVRSVTAAQQ